METAKTEILYQHGNNLYINLTNKCPNRCNFCVRENSSGSLYADNLWYKGKEPEKEEILEELRERNLNHFHHIVFCGYGEPACRWDDMLWLCKQIKLMGSHYIRINTNGLSDLINQRETAGEMDGLVDEVSISLNASTPEKYHALCQSDFGLDALPAILRFTREAALCVPHVQMTVINTLDKEELAACEKLCASVGADFVVREYIED